MKPQALKCRFVNIQMFQTYLKVEKTLALNPEVKFLLKPLLFPGKSKNLEINVKQCSKTLNQYNVLTMNCFFFDERIASQL